jgi:N-acetyl sugar amidotransferase
MTRKKVLLIAGWRPDLGDLATGHFKAARVHHDATLVLIEIQRTFSPFPLVRIGERLINNDPDQLHITISSWLWHLGLTNFLVGRAMEHLTRGQDRPFDLVHVIGPTPFIEAFLHHERLRDTPRLLAVDGLWKDTGGQPLSSAQGTGGNEKAAMAPFRSTDITYYLTTSQRTGAMLVSDLGVQAERIRSLPQEDKGRAAGDDLGQRLSAIYLDTLTVHGKMPEERPYQQCTKCLLDTKDDKAILFDERGVCSYCHRYDRLVTKRLHLDRDRARELDRLIARARKERRHAKYDCLLGVSGGVDSTYVAIKLKERGLNPLLVHLDNGWNSELSVRNIQSIVDHLQLDLHTYVVDWSEFRDIQLAFLRASVVDIELVTDHAIVACLYNLANELGIKYIISGDNFTTEGVMPKGWTHEKSDLLNIRHIARALAGRKLRAYPRLSYLRRQYLVLFKGIKVVPILNYMDYDKVLAKEEITTKLGWKDYMTKHGESIFTRFYQNHILPVKFHVDKRKAHLSALICSGQLDRGSAIAELNAPLYDPRELRADIDFVTKKFGITVEEFDRMMKAPIHKHTDYPSYLTRHYRWEQDLRRRLRPLVRLFKRVTGFQHESNYV